MTTSKRSFAGRIKARAVGGLLKLGLALQRRQSTKTRGMVGEGAGFPVLDPKFAKELLKTINDPDSHGVHILFNTFWQYMPEEVKQKYLVDFRTDPLQRAFYQERYFPEPYEFEWLAGLPTDSFGYTYYRHVVDNNLNRRIDSEYRAFHNELEMSGTLDRMPEEFKYTALRGFQTHDLLHIVTGFEETTVLGEIALQAFGLAQMRNSYFAMWIAVATARMAFIDPDIIRPLMDAITEGWTLGRMVPNLMFVNWETMFDRRLADVRMKYGLDPAGRRALGAPPPVVAYAQSAAAE